MPQHTSIRKQTTSGFQGGGLGGASRLPQTTTRPAGGRLTLGNNPKLREDLRKLGEIARGQRPNELIIQDPIKGPTAIRPPSTGDTAAARLAEAFPQPDTRALESIAATLGQSPVIRSTDIDLPTAPLRTRGLDPRFFETQRESLKEQLRQEFFGPLGVLQQRASEESAAGRLGSGVGQQIIQESAIKPFAQAATQIDRDVLQAQLQETARVEQFNAEQMGQFNQLSAQISQANSANRLAAAQATAGLRAEYDRLFATLTDAYAGRADARAIAKLESDTKVFAASLEAQAKAQAIAEERRAAEAQERLGEIEQRRLFLQTLGQFQPETITQESLARGLASEFGATSQPDRTAQSGTAPRTVSMLEAQNQGFIRSSGGQVRGTLVPTGSTAIDRNGNLYTWNGREFVLAV